ncbi:unnamed protein product, partial [Durusdinium trenchii]
LQCFGSIQQELSRSVRARVEEALQACSSLEEAISFLESKVPGTAHQMIERPRRRATGKKAPGAVPTRASTGISPLEEMALMAGHSALLQRVLERPKAKSEETGSSAWRTSSILSRPTPSEMADGTASGDQSVAAPTPVEETNVQMSHSESPCKAVSPSLAEVRAIEPNDQGLKWWKEAAARWPKIYQNLRLEAYLNILRPECPEVAEYLVHFRAGSVSQTPRKRPAAQGDGVKKMRQEGASAMASVPTPSRSSVDGRSPGRCSTQPDMQLNSQADVCKICCCDTSPWHSVRLACSHGWYCASCMLRHAEARLEMGAASITCPECSSILAERDLRKLLPTETIDRLLARSLEQAVSCAEDIRACPTPNCPMRVAMEEGGTTRFKCTMCKKESCIQCGRQPFHRGLTCEEYAEKMRNNTKAAKKERQADQLFEQWMEETGTKQCPRCRMAVTKQNLDRQQTQYSECHKMSCRNCGTRFCFKCLAILTDTYTCGCTIDAHGFINPVTGKIVKHLKKKAKK